jgi:hypothetical protein
MGIPFVRAYETQFSFSEKTDHAVVVEFDRPWRFVFWAQAQYAGAVQLSDEVMFTPQWCEENSPNDQECYEPMMDKQLRYSRIEILESGPARVRVKWTYALNDIQYRVFHGDSHAEEIYTIYPDGLAVREIVIWPGAQSNHGGNTNFWQVHEWYMINAKGSTPSQVLDRQCAFTMRNGIGDLFNLPWPLPTDRGEALCERFPQIADWPNFIGKINMKGIANPFAVICKSQALFPFKPCCICGGNHPYFNLFRGLDPESETGIHNSYVHWPASEREDFIGWVSARGEVGTVPTHSCFIDCNFAMRKAPNHFIETPFPGTTWYVLIGATESGTDGSELDRLALTYRYPAQAVVTGDPSERQVAYEGFDFSVRSYNLFQRRMEAQSDLVELRLSPQPGIPLVNPVLVINGWKSPPETLEVSAGKSALDDQQHRAQIRGRDLVVWIEGTFDEETEFRLTGTGGKE